MNDEEIEAAARRLCDIRGIDAGEMVWANCECAPRWCWLKEEIKDELARQQVVKAMSDRSSSNSPEDYPDHVASGHNPDDLTNSMVGEGWRLLEREEIDAGITGRELTLDIQIWEDAQWDTGAAAGYFTDSTYRTKKPAGFYKEPKANNLPKKEVEPVPTKELRPDTGRLFTNTSRELDKMWQQEAEKPVEQVASETVKILSDIAENIGGKKEWEQASEAEPTLSEQIAAETQKLANNVAGLVKKAEPFKCKEWWLDTVEGRFFATKSNCHIFKKENHEAYPLTKVIEPPTEQQAEKELESVEYEICAIFDVRPFEGNRKPIRKLMMRYLKEMGMIKEDEV